MASESGFKYWRVPCVIDWSDSKITFSPQAEWVGGNYLFTPGAKSLNPFMSIKIGRTISRATGAQMLAAVESMRGAMATLEKLMGSPEPADDTDDAPPDTGAADHKSDNEAGPVTPPTSESLLRLIEVGEAELKLLEV